MEQTTTASTPSTLLNNTPLVVITLLMVDSLHFVFARLLLPYLPPVTSALYVLGVATVQLIIFATATGQLRAAAFRRQPWFFLAIGFLVAASTALNYSAVAYIDAGTASLLGKASIIFGLGFGVFWLRDRLTVRQWVGVAVSLAGVVIITFQPGDYLRLGALMVLTSTFMYALHAALVKKFDQSASLTEFFIFRLLSTSGFLFVFAAASGKLVWPTPLVWLLLLLVGTVDVVISRALYYLALRKLSMSLHSIILTASPVVAIVWALALFGTLPTAQQSLGGVAVLLGVLLATFRRRKTA